MKAIFIKTIFLLCVLQAFSTASAQSLQDYIQEGLANNPGAKARYDLYLAAREKSPQAGALPDPEVGLGVSVLPVETRVGPQWARFSAMQMFPWFGTLASRRDVADHTAEAVHEKFRQYETDLIFKISKVYYQLYKLNRDILINREHLEVLRTYESLAAEKTEKGIGSMVDVLRIQMEIEEYINKLAYLEDRLSPVRSEFNQALNRDLSREIKVPDSLPEFLLSHSTESIVDSILEANNRLGGLRYQQKAMSSAVEVARKEGLPSFGLGLNYITVGKRTDAAPVDNGRDALMPIATIRLPIYRKKYKAKVNEAGLMLESLKEREQEEINDLLTQLELELVNFRDAQRRVLLYEEQKKKAFAAQSIQIESYSVSGKDFEEVLRLQRMLLNYDLQIAKAIRDGHTAVAAIESLWGYRQ